MKFTTLEKILILLSLAVAQPQTVWATGSKGGDSSGGGDRPAFGHGSAWFTGRSKVIKACMTLAPDFEASPSQAEDALKNAFYTWKKYTQDKHAFDPISQGQSFIDELIPAMDVEISKTCNGQEDLRVYFGTTNPEIEEAKTHFDNPIAFSQRTQYDLDAGWGQGFIWIAPSKDAGPDYKTPIWSFDYALKGILLHEVGHILGCEKHVRGTIMDEDIASLLFAAVYESPSSLAFHQLTSIDWERELLTCTLCDARFEGRIGPRGKTAQEKKTFELFMGRPATGPIYVTYHRIIKPTKESTVGLQGDSIILSDSKGSQEFYIEMIYPSVSFLSDEKLFKVSKMNSKTGAESSIYASGGLVQSGYIKTRTGKKILVTLSSNGQESSTPSPHQIMYVFNGQQHMLFNQVLPGM